MYVCMHTLTITPEVKVHEYVYILLKILSSYSLMQHPYVCIYVLYVCMGVYMYCIYGCMYCIYVCMHTYICMYILTIIPEV